MSYTLYKNVKVLNIKTEEVTPTNRPADISGNKFGRDTFSVYVAELSNNEAGVTFSDFKNIVIKGHVLSIAINDKHDVISVINHTNGKEGYLQPTNFLKDVMEGIIPFLLIAGVCGGIAYKAFNTNSYYNAGYIVIATGVTLIGLILRGMNKQYRESKKSFNELKRK